ncbi:hypothetical protein [Polaromonas sp.]|uniref:hypothetical protein n=1 Tax=Polaromonas sp. TaxID=1869339 RepID=UPI001DC8A85D|nr:hypothetical protein [Polaromonas sp.]MBT9477698.1 hypothetical protein [Polaromonas sp.]
MMAVAGVCHNRHEHHGGQAEPQATADPARCASEPTEQTLKVDIRIWRKLGYLIDGQSFAWQWSRGGEVTANIGVSVSNDFIRLGYAVQGTDASQTIQTTMTPCRYGGARTWFQCPVCCGRATVLFMRAGRFACRQCQRVSYTSQSGSAHDRANFRYHQLDALIKAGKPKWQRSATFERLEDRFERVNEQVNRSLMTLIQRLQAGR